MKRISIQWLSILLLSVFTAQISRAQLLNVQDFSGYPIGSSSYGLAYGNGLYLSLTSSSGLYSSTDGESWSRINNADFPNGVDKIEFGNGLFVMAGMGGTIVTSPDGVTWTKRTSGTSNRISSISFLQNKFFALGQNSTVLTSPDGISWSAISIGTTDEDLTNITYGGGQYVIGSRKMGTHIYFSPTGGSNSWTKIFVSNYLINKVQYLKDRFYLFTSSTNVFVSMNAVVWLDYTPMLSVTLPDNSKKNIGTPNQVFSGIYDGSKIILIGYSQYHNSYGSIFTSTDGLSFKLENRTSEIGPGQLVLANNKYFQYGNNGIVMSNDGINFKYIGNNYYAMASNGSNYVGVGTVSTTGVVMKSTDFNTWTQSSMPYNKGLYAVTYTGSKFEAAGENAVVQSTDNGNTWTPLTAPANSFFTALASDPSVIIGAGYTDYIGFLNYSLDGGSSWTYANRENNYYFKIKKENGTYFALGYDEMWEGVIMSSADGKTWTDITPSFSYPVYYYNDVVFDGSKYVFMGMAYTPTYEYDGFFSVSTATPADGNSFSTVGRIIGTPAGEIYGGDWGNGAFVYHDGYFVGAVNDLGPNSTSGQTNIIYSADGISWEAIPLSSYSMIYGITVTGNMLNMLGTSDGKITASIATVLPVSLTNFSASLVNGRSVLTWQTSGETNSNYFTVQHSTDGVNWTRIGEVNAAGQSSSVQNYTFAHAEPQKGNNYYRLLQVDKDNKQQTSAVRKLFVFNSGNIRLYPNPAKDWTMLDLPGTEPAQIRVFASGGQQVMTLRVQNERSVKLSLKNLPAGLYHIVVLQNGQKYSSDIYCQ